ncbi:MAG: DUF4405 domain-containing protein [Eggerthellaceae bacterium]|nr:DUF4405 domain-containing protein [Eggerthellaceae bacterium]
MKMSLERRIAFECGMLLVFVVLQMSHVTGVLVHEVLNAAFFVLVVLHWAVSWKRIRNIHKATRARLVVFLVLPASFLAAVCSGIMLSGLLFGQLDAAGMETWHRAHGWSTRIMLVAVVFHLANNRKMLASFFTKRKR